jgi:1L-myo-inositol 1-phosphate cytidylyltransferase
MSNVVSEAVILMAGSGSRLRHAGENRLKPMLPILGRPLISYTFDALANAGIKKINAIVGFESERLRAGIAQLVPREIELSFIDNPNWQKQNGISLLAAAAHVTAPFLLTMADHLFDRAIVDLIIQNAAANELTLAVDKKIDAIFDLPDAMKVRTQGNRVTAIGKDLTNYNAIDTGLFVCPREIFNYLERAKSRSRGSDCSLADGVRLMATEEKVRAIDIGNGWWQDVDTVEMLEGAERQMQTLPQFNKATIA